MNNKEDNYQQLKPIKKLINNYEITLNTSNNSLKISIIQNHNFIFYESIFHIDYLQKKFNSKSSIKEIYNLISKLILENQIKIEENENIKIIFLSEEENNIELIVEISIKSLIQRYEKLIKKIKAIEEKSSKKKINIKELFVLVIFVIIIFIMFNILFSSLNNNDNKIKEINEKFNIFLKNNVRQINSLENNTFDIQEMNNRYIKEIKGIQNKFDNLKNVVEDITNKIIKYDNKIKEIDKKFYNLEKNNITEIDNKIRNLVLNENITILKETIKKEMNEKIMQFENSIKKIIFKFENNTFNLSKTNLKNIYTIKEHNGSISSVSVFPSGNIISVSFDKSIIIYDINMNVIQIISNAHNDGILYVNIFDENNFVTCSYDQSIKTWIKKDNKFEINKVIHNAHSDYIMKVIYNSKGNIISCGLDGTIKIWEEKNNQYQNVTILNHSNWVYSILLLEDKNILISSGNDGTKFWDLNNNYNEIIYFPDTYCHWNNGLERIGDDLIIVGGKVANNLKIISITYQELINEIEFDFYVYGIKYIENKGIFLVGGNSKDIKIFRSDNFEFIKEIQNAHEHWINGYVELKDGSVGSYSGDKTIKIWSL